MDDNITKIETDSGVEDIEDAPIYFQNKENEVLTGKNMLYVQPRVTNKNYRINAFSRVAYDPDSSIAYYYFGKKTCKKLTDFQHVLVFNIEYYRNLFYNYDVKLKKYQMWLVVFSSRNFKELYNTLNYVVNDSIRDKLIRDVIDMFSDGFRLCNWENARI